MTAPRCLTCDVVFRQNHALAALTHGRRIAFDPARGRVWRLCAGCGAWNLLGEVETPGALTELGARFPLPGTGVQSHRHSSTLEVLRIHDLEGSSPGDLAIGLAMLWVIPVVAFLYVLTRFLAEGASSFSNHACA